jgi:hypothetical protein
MACRIFVIIYRRRRRANKTEIFVRKSSNGPSKYGLGIGVPVTSWMLSSSSSVPNGYQLTTPKIQFNASNCPGYDESSSSEPPARAYDKIVLRRDAFNENQFQDDEIQQYSTMIRDTLKKFGYHD